MSFKREVRYTIFKCSDVDAYLSTKEILLLRGLQVKIDDRRIEDERVFLDCVVVEHDWPEYEKVWQMIEDRVMATGKE